MRNENPSKAALSETLWNKQTTAKYLGISVKTLDRWLAAGRGPLARKIGAQVRFLPSDVFRFVGNCKTIGGGVAA